jgi:hypothetical protein
MPNPKGPLDEMTRKQKTDPNFKKGRVIQEPFFGQVKKLICQNCSSCKFTIIVVMTTNRDISTLSYIYTQRHFISILGDD